MLIFMKSMIIGLCIAAPVGPIGLLCIPVSYTHLTLPTSDLV